MTLRPRRENALSSKEQSGVRPKIDVTDEAVIDAPPMAVYKAVLDEYAGVTSWFMPILAYKLRGDTAIGEGSIVDITINPKGRAKSRVSEKMIKLVEAKSIVEEVASDFAGDREWIFEPAPDGKTRVQYRFDVKSTTLLASVISPFVNIAKMHSDAMQKGYKALNNYLNNK